MRIRVGVLAGAFLSLTLATAASLAAQGAAATICKDGTTSVASGRGACSGHGGVDAKATDVAKKGAAKVDKAESKAASATAKAEKTTEKAAKSTDKAADKAAEKTAAQTSKADAAAAKTASKAESKVEKSESKAADKAAKTTKTASSLDNKDPTNATAQCKDGTYSHATHHQGACSNHGGVAKFLK
ncbi:MAG TPA: DUF3761 domain-containing protein [Gemmatimonadaceae bacterium]|jgi:hypothetical protein|nr:DUF3761 domain-containing protein [Gemmatimonadaceae bacterium]